MPVIPIRLHATWGMVSCSSFTHATTGKRKRQAAAGHPEPFRSTALCVVQTASLQAYVDEPGCLSVLSPVLSSGLPLISLLTCMWPHTHQAYEEQHMHLVLLHVACAVSACCMRSRVSSCCAVVYVFCWCVCVWCSADYTSPLCICPRFVC